MSWLRQGTRTLAAGSARSPKAFTPSPKACTIIRAERPVHVFPPQAVHAPRRRRSTFTASRRRRSTLTPPPQAVSPTPQAWRPPSPLASQCDPASTRQLLQSSCVRCSPRSFFLVRPSGFEPLTYGSGGRRKAGELGLSSDESGDGAIVVCLDPPPSAARCPLPVPIVRRAADAALGTYLRALAEGWAEHVGAPA